MRKSDLHSQLQATCAPVPGKSGCFAVIMPPVPGFINVPSCHPLIVLAQRELDLLGEAIAQNQDYADPLLHMLNRREAVDSSQIEGIHTSFDGLLAHELGVGGQESRAGGWRNMKTRFGFSGLLPLTHNCEYCATRYGIAPPYMAGAQLVFYLVNGESGAGISEGCCNL